ncbi:hypothetical protein EUX98_g720 [Antrodiella citrinella]|uniref:Uncharacterized protein n=1 Tax=Antrodiella citrinella TaxID=2447956 RepID=A0A4S4N672_9APHY|nr:hypothetical protein EUX98_g720 [Antrodiella citrinella]
MSKSERVETLERIAADAERKFSDMSNYVPEVMNLCLIDKEKTLPAPPVPSQKKRILSGLAGSRPAPAQTLFPPGEPADQTPPTPTLAAVASLKVPRAGGPLSGLDALEARLLAEVGTKKVETDTKRPDVRSILPIPIPKPQGEDPINDSAISSLDLPGLGADEMTKIGKASSAHSGVTYRDGQRGRSREARRERKEPSDETETKSKQKKKKKKERQGDGKDVEAYRLRKAAQGRITAWLDRIDPDAPSSPAAASNSTEEDANHELSGSEVLMFEPPMDQTEDTSYPRTPVAASINLADPEPVTETVAQPNPRSSGFVPISTLRANRRDPPVPTTKDTSDVVKLPSNLQKYLPVYPPRSLDPEVRYDVRSARGGRGGKVAAVTALWASATQTPSQPSQTPRPSVSTKVMKPTPFTSKPPAERKQEGKPAPTPVPPRLKERPSPRQPTATSNTTDVAPRLPAKRTKAAFSPAIVSSSLATPMLSSTASLARPPALTTDRIRFKNQVSSTVTDIREGVPVVSPKPVPVVKTEMAFGQARLKELIKKYQGQASA